MKFSNFRYFHSILVILYLCSCIDSENIIFLDQTTNFQIPKKSKLIRKMQTDVDDYRRLTNQNLSPQLVLYKILIGTNYLMYVGVAIDLDSAQIQKQLLSNRAYSLVDQKTPTTDSEAILLQIDSNRFCYHFIKQFKGGDKYLFSVISKDKNFLENMFNSNSIVDSFVDD